MTPITIHMTWELFRTFYTSAGWSEEASSLSPSGKKWHAAYNLNGGTVDALVASGFLTAEGHPNEIGRRNGWWVIYTDYWKHEDMT
jgi:hypothetical protein